MAVPKEAPDEVSVADAKRDLADLLAEAPEQPVVITRRDEPDTALVSYEDYTRMRRARAAAEIRRISEELRGRGIKLQELIAESRRELEERGD
ncbi:MAG: type II toxin-antitoxin system prevent-host-death family antitoxin [Anaerolineae bacterium]